ncbi:glycosyltransferase family 2 protein [Parapedobacter sp. 10938]|uniref:glycosyltransferase family 2 protein n=1 Tax=Parapedobacter flavus TaxID=3110225 RepID=UPI002DBE6358|nr:glycosyltransferase family 2 protein [Parapedobacter sp. 10938]MEC3879917.1 glycosyltransferase family 2 protein [Parapedobacter sp. 10938]
MELFFWISLFIIGYTYIGYGMVLYALTRLKRLIAPKQETGMGSGDAQWPSCTIIVAAYNEASVIEEKVRNTLALQYPDGKINYCFVTDGSTDATPDIVRRFPQVDLLHTDARGGKIAAVHRAMEQVTTEVVIFTDANTLLNETAVQEICKRYEDPEVGAVAGEKRVHADAKADASAAGEGFYWKYESALKQWDSTLHTVVGSAGELFSIRRSLYEPVSPDTILDDFMISMRIAERGYRVVYEPKAYATEMASENVEEELKRKIRIAAGGIQSILRLKRAPNPFSDPVLAFQYISHRVLRWTVTPILLVVVFILNVLLHTRGAGEIYTILFYGQMAFYLCAVLGLLLERRALRVKMLFIPYYFCVMNYAVIAGILRFFSAGQSAIWERSSRKQDNRSNGSAVA